MPSLYAAACATTELLTIHMQASRLPRLTSKDTDNRQHKIIRPRTELGEGLSNLLDDGPIMLMLLEGVFRFVGLGVIFLPQRYPIDCLLRTAQITMAD